MMKVEKFLNFLTIVLIVIYMIYIRFSNDMTNVELLLCYWKEYLDSVIIMAICYYLFKNE